MVKIIKERDYVVEINQKDQSKVSIKYDDLVIEIDIINLVSKSLEQVNSDSDTSWIDELYDML